MWIRSIEVFLTILFVVVIVTQMIVPAWNDRPTFPIFRRRRQAEVAITKAKEALDLKIMKAELDELRSRLDDPKPPTPTPVPASAPPSPRKPSAKKR